MVVNSESWRKSSRSATGNCAEVSNWRKSGYSEPGTCVEVGDGAIIGIRDTKEAHLGDSRTILEFSPRTWQVFTTGIKRG